MNNVQILIISNSTDFTTDHISLELKKRGVAYLRINRDHFDKYKLNLDVVNSILKIMINDKEYICENDYLKAIYYRAPTFLRDNYQPNLTIEQQLYRSQWSAFIRNLTIFDKCLWMNNPVCTYRAENKFLQLHIAKQIGFNCPDTIVTNTNEVPNGFGKKLVVKSIDTALMTSNNYELFSYTNIVNIDEIPTYENSIAPFFIQSYISPKIDIRVTTVGNKVFPISITKSGKGIEGDWRLEKENVEYQIISLPIEIENLCIKLLEEFSLKFGGIDLVMSNGKYYFIEINPTGEWSWLVNKTGVAIQQVIGDYLCGRF